MLELDYKKLGTRLRTSRLKLNLTQQKLAEIVNLSSVYISHIERGSGKTSLETLLKLCTTLKVTPDYILLDSIYTSKEYLIDELAILLKNCSEKNLKTITAVVRTILEVQKD